MIWNYVETAELVSLHVVFRNLVAPVITSGETTWGYRELQVSRKLEHGSRHYTSLVSGVRKVGFLVDFRDALTLAGEEFVLSIEVSDVAILLNPWIKRR